MSWKDRAPSSPPEMMSWLSERRRCVVSVLEAFWCRRVGWCHGRVTWAEVEGEGDGEGRAQSTECPSVPAVRSVEGVRNTH